MVKLHLFADKKNQEDIDEQLKLLTRKVKAAVKSIEEQETILKTSIKEVHILKEEQEQLATKTKTLVQNLEEATNKLNKTTLELALFKPKLEKELIDKFSTTIEQELAHTTNKIHAESNGFNAAKDTFSKHIQTSKELHNEIKKFQDIAKNIKEKDFTLEKHAKEIEKRDGEKLRLMQKIDKLENMLAKMKRGK